MKERGPQPSDFSIKEAQRISQAEGLTPEGQSSYARSGEIFSMPEGGTSQFDRPPFDEEKPKLVQPNEVPFFPRQNEYLGITQEGEEDTGTMISMNEAFRRAKFMADQYTREHGQEPSEELKNTFLYQASRGIKPAGYNPPPNIDDGLILPQSVLNDRVKEKELSPEEQIEQDLAKLPVDERQQRRNYLASVDAFERDHPDYPKEAIDHMRNKAANGIDPRSSMEDGRTEGAFHREAENKLEELMIARIEERERSRGKIDNMNQLFEEIMMYSDPKFGVGGDYALLDFITKEGPDGKLEIVETKINQKNFVYWVRDRISFFHNDSPDDDINFFQKVALQRDWRDISIGSMLEDQARYFRDDKGNQYRELADFVRLNLWQIGAYRSSDLQYKAVMGEEEGLPRALIQMYYKSTFTKPAFYGQSALANVLTMAADFDSKPVSKEEAKRGHGSEHPENLDTKLGGAINTAFLTYYYISDAEKLRELLGEDTALLNKDKLREAVRKAAAKHYKKDLNELSDQEAMRYIESTDGKAGSDARFLFSNEKVTEKQIISFINIFNAPTKAPPIVSIVNGLLREEMVRKYGLNDINAEYAQIHASVMARMYGAGWRNDTGAAAYDAGAKPGKLREYRIKQANGERGGAMGNPYSVYMIKASLVDYLSAARSEVLVEDENGNVYKDREGNTHYYSLLQLMELMEKAGSRRDGTNDDEVEKKVKELAGKLRPIQNSMRDWATNHMTRAFKVYDELLTTAQIDFSKFTDTDAWGNIRINRAAFEKEVKDSFMKTLRYGYSTFNSLDFSKMVRVQDTKGNWRDEPLALQLFGREIYDIEEFWKRDYEMDKDGNYVTEKVDDGHGHKVDKKKIKKLYEHEIDYSRVNANKKYMWKMIALGRLAADIYAHRDHYSTDPRYGFAYYKHMIEALESIPGDIDGDEMGDSFRTTKTKDHFFDHAQMDWFLDRADIKLQTLRREQLKKDVFKGSWDAMKEIVDSFWKSIFKF